MNCAISGESLTNAKAGTVVVTPSGHVCRRDLLLAKLTENGGVDPFSPNGDRPLSEDELIVLATDVKSSSSSMPPRPIQASSVPNLLTALQQEYDAVLLELFDTRQALQDTRQELSQALYQNDAALRVIARLAAERDAARKGAVMEGGGTTTAANDAGDASSGGTTKKRKHSDMDEALVNEIAESELTSMVAVWEDLHKGRKALMKELGSKAPAVDQVEAFCANDKKKTTVWSSATATAVAYAANSNIWAQVVDQAVQVNKATNKKSLVKFNLESGTVVTALDVSDDWVAWGTAEGSVQFAKVSSKAKVSTITTGSKVVDISLHYDGGHALLATEDGQVCLVSLEAAKVVSVFTPPTPQTQYTTAALHPDGLIYVTGTSEGNLLLWDLKSSSLAATLPGTTSLTDVTVSPNGYHIAAATTAEVQIWDLRKQKLIATLSAKSPISNVAFDAAAKFVMFTETNCVTMAPVKEWDRTVKWLLEEPSHIVWSSNTGIILSSKDGITNYGKP
jgi:pre-mRNA-processing factor 19